MRMDYTGTKVLLVEDNAIARMAASKLVASFGCEIEQAETGKQALAMLAQNTYDLVLMDVGLPDDSGFAITEMVRSKNGPNKDAPIIALTSYTENAHRNQASWVGMSGFIEKPLLKENLVNVLSKFLHMDKAA